MKKIFKNDKKNGLVSTSVTQQQQQAIIESKTKAIKKARATNAKYISGHPKNYAEAYQEYRFLVGYDKLPKSYAQQLLDGTFVGNIADFDKYKNKEAYVELIYQEYLKFVQTNPTVVLSNNVPDILSTVYIEFKLKSLDDTNCHNDVIYKDKNGKIHNNIHPDFIKNSIRKKLKRRYFMYHNKQFLTFTSIESLMDFVNNNYSK